MKHRIQSRSLILALLVLLAVAPIVSAAPSSTTREKATLTIKGMSCDGCVATVKRMLKRTLGVIVYEVSLERGEADVTYDPGRTNPKKIAESVSETGFAAFVKESAGSGKGSSTGRTPEPSVEGGRLEPWEPVDVAFRGCSDGGCGIRGRNARAVVQPGARPGQYVYCPVSGAVFQIKDSTLQVDVHGKTLYLCCSGCARYFAENRDQILALRALSL